MGHNPKKHINSAPECKPAREAAPVSEAAEAASSAGVERALPDGLHDGRTHGFAKADRCTAWPPSPKTTEPAGVGVTAGIVARTRLGGIPILVILTKLEFLGPIQTLRKPTFRHANAHRCFAFACPGPELLMGTSHLHEHTQTPRQKHSANQHHQLLRKTH